MYYLWDCSEAWNCNGACRWCIDPIDKRSWPLGRPSCWRISLGGSSLEIAAGIGRPLLCILVFSTHESTYKLIRAVLNQKNNSSRNTSTLCSYWLWAYRTSIRCEMLRRQFCRVLFPKIYKVRIPFFWIDRFEFSQLFPSSFSISSAKTNNEIKDFLKNVKLYRKSSTNCYKSGKLPKINTNNWNGALTDL